MAKPILATNIDGFLIKHSAFFEPHRTWFDRAILLTKNAELKSWKGREDYFKGVDEAMKQIMPKATEKERTEQARKWYQEDVVYYIKENPEVVRKELIENLKALKAKYRLALVTTNTKEYIDQILESAGLQNIFDIVFAIDLAEKPDKEKLFESFIKKYGKPMAYIAGKNGDRFEKLISFGIITIYAPFDKFDPETAKEADKTARNSEELIEIIKSL